MNFALEVNMRKTMKIHETTLSLICENTPSLRSQLESQCFLEIGFPYFHGIVLK